MNVQFQPQFRTAEGRLPFECIALVLQGGGAHGVRANVICPGFVRTPLAEKQIPEQARELGISKGL